MGKISASDKMRIQTLHELGLGYRRIVSKFPDKQWNLQSVKNICRRVDQRGSATERKSGQGRPRSARTADNIEQVAELICSQEDAPGTSKSTRSIANHLNISERSVRRIAKVDLSLSAFRRVPVQVINAATKQKRLERCKRLLRRLSVTACKRVFFTDEKIFYVNPPVNNQNNRVWSAGKKRCVPQSRLLIERAKFAPHVMVSAGISFEGKGGLHFVDEKAKVNADYYVKQLLPKLVGDCHQLLGEEFIFQQDGAPAHAAKVTQQWLAVHCPDFIDKDSWPPNSPDINPLDYHVWGSMLEKFGHLNPQPKDIQELKSALTKIWDELSQDGICKSITSFRKRLRACVNAEGGHFEHLL